MLDLMTLQRQFQNYILNSESGIETEIDNSKVKYNVNRLAIYADMYALRLQEALEITFPTLGRVMRTANFHDLLQKYITKNPSTNFTINYFAEKLPGFLRQTLPYAQSPYYAELAEFEWAIQTTIDAEDAPIATVADLQAISPDTWPEIIFRFHPSCKFLQLHYNVDELWYAHDKQQPLPEIIKYPAPPLHLLWRNQLQPFHQAYHGPARLMLLQAKEGHPFAALCESLCEFMDEDSVAPFAIEQVGAWLNGQAITGIE
jgi:hypothetical protein